MNLGFWETAHVPLHLPHLPLPYVNTYFSLTAKCWVREGVGGQFPGNLNWSNLTSLLVRDRPLYFAIFVPHKTVGIPKLTEIFLH